MSDAALVNKSQAKGARKGIKQAVIKNQGKTAANLDNTVGNVDQNARNPMDRVPVRYFKTDPRDEYFSALQQFEVKLNGERDFW